MSRADQAIRKIEKGRLEAAARILAGDKSANPIPEVLSQLRNKHSTGHPNPFNLFNLSDRQAIPTLIPDLLQEVINKLNSN